MAYSDSDLQLFYVMIICSVMSNQAFLVYRVSQTTSETNTLDWVFQTLELIHKGKSLRTIAKKKIKDNHWEIIEN